jgi:hypothetical protein
MIVVGMGESGIVNTIDVDRIWHQARTSAVIYNIVSRHLDHPGVEILQELYCPRVCNDARTKVLCI